MGKEKRTVLKLKIVELDKQGFHYFLKAKVNEKSARFLLDTGASHTVMDLTRIKSFIDHSDFEENPTLSTGLGTNTMQSQIAHIESFQLGKAVLKDFEMILMDLSHVNESYRLVDKKPLDGVLGSNVLRKLEAKINFGKNPSLRLKLP
ncbi:MAG: retroviral-like aspartic protease family protein [Bacteroidia bacterium]|nr:retroviral-like aspartic protease family protein [Bacteroidia bacterium]